MANDLAEEIQKQLTMYSEEITKSIDNIAKNKVEKLVEETKKTAPVSKRKGRKHYKNNITFKKTVSKKRGSTYTWYVKGSDYRLSHLLENGHATRNGGRLEGTGFIKKATDPIIDEFENEVEELIRNGS